MIAQKRLLSLLSLRRRLPSPPHVSCHGGLPDIDAPNRRRCGSSVPSAGRRQ